MNIIEINERIKELNKSIKKMENKLEEEKNELQYLLDAKEGIEQLTSI